MINTLRQVVDVQSSRLATQILQRILVIVSLKQNALFFVKFCDPVDKRRSTDKVHVLAYNLLWLS
jgi:hypothetical protein